MKFVFDLDGTLTKSETLPIIAAEFNLEKDLATLTDKTVQGEVPFLESFLQRVEILSEIDQSQISELLSEVGVNPNLLQFILENNSDCIIATGNYRGWVEQLCKKFKCEYRCSEGSVVDGKVKLSKVFLKEDLVKELKKQGEFVVFIGDGNNDAEAMRLSDVSIACGIVHQPAASLMQLCDFVIYDDKALSKFLKQIKAEQDGQTVVVSCAGIGSRLGLGKTKALVEISGIPIIKYIIDYFSEIEDLRVVVGFQAPSVIELVLKIRRDVIFAFNHDYFHTKTGASLALGSRFCLDYVLAWDGDFIVKASDVRKIIEKQGEFICCTQPTSSEPVFVIKDKTSQQATGFSRVNGELEWSGPAKIKRENISYNDGNTYNLLEPLLPMQILEINGTDVDTYDDYLRIPKLLREWNYSNESADVFYRKLANKIQSPLETRNLAPDFGVYDVEMVRAYGNERKAKLLELGAGTGLMTNELSDYFSEIVAVEKFKEFAQFIKAGSNVRIILEDLLFLKLVEKFDVVTIFGVMNYFNEKEAQHIYRLAYNSLNENGTLIVKHNMGLMKDVYVDKISDELNTYYFSSYRSLENEKKMISNTGFFIDDVIDIYPDKFNRYSNTRYYAIIGKKTSVDEIYNS